MYSVVGSDGAVYGPVDMAILAQWIAEGRVTPTTNLIDPIDGRVIPAGHAPALMGNFPPTPIQAPPMPGIYGQQSPHGPNFNVGQTPIQVNIHNQIGGYPRPDPMQPYYGAPPKSKVVAALLAFFLGCLGVHRFYLGHTGTGVAMLALTLCTCWFGGTVITGIWALVDLVLILTGTLREANGRALVG